MLSRPKFKGKYFLRVVMGNYNTKESHIEELLRLLDAYLINMGRSKIIAIVTGFISIAICIAYLLLITIFDFRTYLNDQISNFT